MSKSNITANTKNETFRSQQAALRDDFNDIPQEITMNDSIVPATSTTGPTTDSPMSDMRMLYWVAINGDSAALAPFPLPVTVSCTPTPQLLVGLNTLQRARALQATLLTAPMHMVRKEVKAMCRSVEAVCIEPANPGRPTRGATLWSS
jgi:hypothetical protein